jgi:alkanesulfonate monooxygenase SsuD/methylene tetrahydromethanopterin reductase-like flavin-dependent oxidoreductase (luciferase family)
MTATTTTGSRCCASPDYPSSDQPTWPRGAREDFFPGYARTFTTVGRERGWPPVRRADFDALVRPEGALLVGDPDEVADKILRHSEALGGLSRVTLQMDVATLPHATLMRSIELLGDRVAPTLRGTLAPSA